MAGNNDGDVISGMSDWLLGLREQIDEMLDRLSEDNPDPPPVEPPKPEPDEPVPDPQKAWSSALVGDKSVKKVPLKIPDKGSTYTHKGESDVCYLGNKEKKAFTGTPYKYPLQIVDWKGGGAVVGLHAEGVIRDQPWRWFKAPAHQADGDGIRIESGGRTIIEGSRFDWNFDAISTLPVDNAARKTAYFIIRHCRFVKILDDVWENDLCCAGEMTDCLVDGCFNFFSKRPGKGANNTCPLPETRNTFRNNVVRLEPMFYDKGLPLMNNQFHKPGGRAGRCDWVGNVLLIEQPPVGASETRPNGAYWWPVGEHSNNTVCWLGKGEFPGRAKVPAGFKIVTDDGPYKAAKAAWLKKHPDLAA
jgi:hypothetical protein